MTLSGFVSCVSFGNITLCSSVGLAASIFRFVEEDVGFFFASCFSARCFMLFYLLRMWLRIIVGVFFFCLAIEFLFVHCMSFEGDGFAYSDFLSFEAFYVELLS